MRETGLDLAQRSVEIILASQAPSGAFIAGSTFSQYGYCWQRDGAFIAHALDVTGESAAAGRFHDWMSNVVLARREGLERAADAGRRGERPAAQDYLHCRYSSDGTESGVEWPAFQLDGPGIWLWSLGEHVAHGGELTSRHANAAAVLVEYLTALWQCPSYDAWEEHPEHVHTSTLAAIAAGLRAAGAYLTSRTPAARSRETAELILEHLRGTAYDGYLPKWPGNPAVDGSLLWLGEPYRLLRLDEPLFAATLATIERDLVAASGGVYRYRADTYYGGGQWILLTAALGTIYAVRGAPGDRERALRCVEWIERQADVHGFLPEQVDENVLHPQRSDEWVRSWGPSARPLVWSHAAYLLLRCRLELARP